MPKTQSVPALRQRYQTLKDRIRNLGLVQIGSVTERIDRRPDAQGRPRQRGPYYQWTFKEKGKTRTVNLSAQQARQWRKAIANQRQLEKLARQMRALSTRILDQTTQSPPRRKPAR